MVTLVDFNLWCVCLCLLSHDATGISTDNLLAEDLQLTDELQDRVAPYAMSAWLVSCYCSKNSVLMSPKQYQDYPPVPSPFPDNSSRPFRSNTTPYYTIKMFGHNVSLKPPPLTPAAILAFCPRADAYLVRWARNAPNTGDSQDNVDRADRLLSSSVAGLYDTDDSGDHPLNNHLFSTPSERFDDDWQRLLPSLGTEHETSTVRLYNDALSHLPRLFAVISGTWEGRMEV